jgi:hypothetical protein
MIAKDIFQIQEIPFITNKLNYLDIVKCEQPTETKPRLFISVIKASGYKTYHVKFPNKVDNIMKRRIIMDLVEKGARYRRSGLQSFSISISPELILSGLTEEVLELLKVKHLENDSRREIGPAEQSLNHLNVLLGKLPKLQDGTADDPELGVSIIAK